MTGRPANRVSSAPSGLFTLESGDFSGQAHPNDAPRWYILD